MTLGILLVRDRHLSCFVSSEIRHAAYRTDPSVLDLYGQVV